MNTRKIRRIADTLRVTAPYAAIGRRLDHIEDTLKDLIAAILEDEESVIGDQVDVRILIVNTREWTRWTEVENYARFHDITDAEALKRLVNSGLSHENRGWTS